MLFSFTSEDVFAVYLKLKDKYPVFMTTTAELNAGFTVNCPILVGKAHGQKVWLYEYDGWFVLDVVDEPETMGTHWHPETIENAAADIAEFMNGKSDYKLQPFE